MWYRLILGNKSLAIVASWLEERPKTQSSAKARFLSEACPLTEIPVNFCCNWLESGLIAKLYSTRERGSPCFKPQVGKILLVQKFELLTWK